MQRPEQSVAFSIKTNDCSPKPLWKGARSEQEGQAYTTLSAPQPPNSAKKKKKRLKDFKERGTLAGANTPAGLGRGGEGEEGGEEGAEKHGAQVQVQLKQDTGRGGHPRCTSAKSG